MYDTPSEPDIDLILRPQICNANTELIKISRLQSHSVIYFLDGLEGKE